MIRFLDGQAGFMHLDYTERRTGRRRGKREPVKEIVMTELRHSMPVKTVHRTTFVGKCPLGCDDHYEAEFVIRGPQPIPVENIQKAIDDVIAKPKYQEMLTIELAARLKCEVRTIGTHGNFRTECRVKG